MFKKLLLAMVVIICIVLASINHRVYNFFNDLLSSTENSIESIDMIVDIDAKPIPQIKKNLSGITYSSSTKTLFAVSNSPRYIYELNKDGTLIRTIDLQGFKDTEAIVHIKENLFVIADERKKSFYLIKINKSTKVIHRKKVIKEFKLALYDEKNSGFEGLAYDNKNDTLYIANEKNPAILIKAQQWFKNQNEPLKVLKVNREDMKIPAMRDFAGLHFDSNRGLLWVLSHESKRLLVLDTNNNPIGMVQLASGHANLKENIPQAEGVTLDDEFLYIVSEPNLFYRFKLKP